MERPPRVIAGESFVPLIDPANRHFAGVGADRVWPASELLARFLAVEVERLMPLDGLVVEIGAGACPLPGMWLARRMPASRCVLTDLPYLLPLIDANVRRNFPDQSARPEVAALRWGCNADALALPRGADLAIAADVLYFQGDMPNLVATLLAVGAKVTVVAVLDQHRDGCGPAFMEAAAAHWDCEMAGADFRTCVVNGRHLPECSIFVLRPRAGAGRARRALAWHSTLSEVWSAGGHSRTRRRIAAALLAVAGVAAIVGLSRGRRSLMT